MNPTFYDLWWIPLWLAIIIYLLTIGNYRRCIMRSTYCIYIIIWNDKSKNYLPHQEYMCKCSTNTFIFIYHIPGNIDNFNGLIMNTYFKHRSPLANKVLCRPTLVAGGVSLQQDRTHTHTHILCDHFCPSSITFKMFRPLVKANCHSLWLKIGSLWYLKCCGHRPQQTVAAYKS